MSSVAKSHLSVNTKNIRFSFLSINYGSIFRDIDRRDRRTGAPASGAFVNVTRRQSCPLHHLNPAATLDAALWSEMVQAVVPGTRLFLGHLLIRTEEVDTNAAMDRPGIDCASGSLSGTAGCASSASARGA
jgi:hypothetical protein